MKSIVLSLFLLMFCGITSVRASMYYYFNPSQITVKTIYNGKGEVIGKQEFRLTRGNENSVGGENRIVKKGQEPEITECLYSINDSGLMVSMGRNSGGKDVFLDYRPDMNRKGGIIVNTVFETTTQLAGREIQVSCTVSNRKVHFQREIISSSAGKWECIKTEYDMEFRGKIFGLGIPVSIHVVEWFAPGTGIVRTDVYRRGKLHEMRLLTEFRAI